MLGSDILCNILVDSCIEIFLRMLLQMISYNRDTGHVNMIRNMTNFLLSTLDARWREFN